MDNGAGPQGPGSIGATWELGLQRLAAEARSSATRYFLGPSGALGAQAGEARARRATSADPKRAPAQTLPGDGDGGRLEGAAALRLGAARGRQGPRLRDRRRSTQDVVIAGPSSLDLYLKSSARDTDLQVTLSEVRPDGNETYVQNGWLRASHRKLDAAQLDRLDPFPTHLKRDAAPLPRGRFTLVRVPISPWPTPSAPARGSA